MDIYTIGFGMLGGAISYLFIAMIQKLPRTKNNNKINELQVPVCPKCKNRNLKTVWNEPNKLICGKCYSIIDKAVPVRPEEAFQFLNSETPVPVPPEPHFICRYCKKELDSEFKLRKHIGMSHSDKIEL
jgi:hypothetical protein